MVDQNGRQETPERSGTADGGIHYATVIQCGDDVEFGGCLDFDEAVQLIAVARDRYHAAQHEAEHAAEGSAG